jgi:RNA polymerase sigma factor (sigma-70 family)
VFQEVLATVWAKLSHIHRHPNPHAYILKICVNHSYESLRERARRKRREVPLEAEHIEDRAAPQTDAPEDDRDVEALVRAAVVSLPVQQAQAVLLRLLDGESYPVIGRILECSEITARSHVSKGGPACVKSSQNKGWCDFCPLFPAGH